jgi:hypothetical protein
MVCAGDSGEGGSSDNGEKANHDCDGENRRRKNIREDEDCRNSKFQDLFILDGKAEAFQICRRR